MEITKGVHGKIDIWMEKKKVQKGKGKEVGQKLESMEKFLGMRKLEGRAMLWEPQAGKKSPVYLNT